MYFRTAGLVVRAPFPLFGAKQVPDIGSGIHCDLDVRFGETPERLDSPDDEGANWWAKGATALVDVPGTCRLMVVDGCSITVSPTAGADPSQLGYAVMGVALSVALVQRRQIVMHASGVRSSGRAILFAGRSGAGKSTLLLTAVELGAEALFDDVAPLSFEPGDKRVRAATVGSSVTAWPDVIRYFSHLVVSSRALRAGLPKQALSVRQAATDFSPVGAVVIISRSSDSEPRCDRIEGRRAFALLERNVRGRKIAHAFDPRGHLHRLSTLAQVVPVYLLRHDRQDLSSTPRLVRTVMETVLE